MSEYPHPQRHAARLQELRASVTLWARTLLDAPQGFIVLDTETTGVMRQDYVIEIAAVHSSGEVLFEQLIKPPVPIPPFVSRIHGITDATVRHAPSYDQIHQRLQEAVFYGVPVLAYNAPFDRRMLEQTAAHYELRINRLKTLMACAMRQYRNYAAHTRGHSLAAACQREGVPQRGAHRALADALMTLDLIYAMGGHRHSDDDADDDA
jgi:DNA polymerase III subunit epsilon